MAKMSFYIVGPVDGSIRIAVDQGEDTPPYMRSVGKFRTDQMTGPEWSATVAAVKATPPRSLDGDRDGLKWSTREAAETAMAAAIKAVRSLRNRRQG